MKTNNEKNLESLKNFIRTVAKDRGIALSDWAVERCLSSLGPEALTMDPSDLNDRLKEYFNN